MSLDALLNTTITLQRPTTTADTSGGSVRAWSNIVTVAANVQPLSTMERAALAQRMVYVSHRVYVAQDIGVERGDRLLTADGRYLIARGQRDMAGQSIAWAIEAREQT